MSTAIYKAILEATGEENSMEKWLVSLYLCKTHQGPKGTIYQTSSSSWVCSADAITFPAWVSNGSAN